MCKAGHDVRRGGSSRWCNSPWKDFVGQITTRCQAGDLMARWIRQDSNGLEWLGVWISICLSYAYVSIVMRRMRHKLRLYKAPKLVAILIGNQ